MAPLCVLATTPRSGSHYLMSCLAAPGIVLLAEYASPYRRAVEEAGHVTPEIRSALLLDVHRSDATRALSRISALGQRGFQRCGIKLMPKEIELILAGWPSLEAFFEAPEVRVVRLVRDPVDQAVSVVLARATARWFQYRGDAPVATPDYDAALIQAALSTVQQQEAKLDVQLRGRDILTVSYQALVDEPEAVVRAVAAHVGCPLPLDVAVPRPDLFQKQSGDHGRRVAARFREEHSVG